MDFHQCMQLVSHSPANNSQHHTHHALSVRHTYSHTSIQSVLSPPIKRSITMPMLRIEYSLSSIAPCPAWLQCPIAHIPHPPRILYTRTALCTTPKRIKHACHLISNTVGYRLLTLYYCITASLGFDSRHQSDSVSQRTTVPVVAQIQSRRTLHSCPALEAIEPLKNI